MKNAPMGEKCTARRVHSLDFVAVKAEAHGLQVNMPNSFSNALHGGHGIPLDLKALNTSSPNRRVSVPKWSIPARLSVTVWSWKWEGGPGLVLRRQQLA